MIIRHDITSKVLSLLAWSPAVALLGPRQVGKTTLARHLEEQLAKPVLYVDLENPDDRQKVMAGTFFFEAHQDHCIILDEVQREPALFGWLRAFIDAHRVPARFILLGSANPLLLKQANESLAGRVIYVTLSGIHVKELPAHLSLSTHWLRGGFPTPLLQQQTARRTAWHRSFLKAFVEVDLPALGLTTPPLALYRLITMLAHQHGAMWNASSLAKALGINHKTVAMYRDFLEQTYFVRVLPPFFTNAKKKIVKSPKVYVRDSGVLHYLARVTTMDDLLGHPVAGYSWEGYVLDQVMAYVQILADDLLECSFYRTREGTECDLVVARGGTPLVAIEMKLGNNPKTTKGLTYAVRDLGTPHNFIVVPQCEKPYALKQDIMVTDVPALLSSLATILA